MNPIHFVVLFFVFFARSYIFPLGRQKREIVEITSGNITFYPYTIDLGVNLAIDESRTQISNNFTVAIDTSSKYFVLMCCEDDQSIMRENCVNLTVCSNRCKIVKDGECSRMFRHFTVFDEKKIDETHPVLSGVTLLQESLNFSQIEFAGEDLTDALNQQERNIEIVLSGEGLYNHTQGIIGLSYSFLNNSFNRIFNNKFADEDRWFSFDFFMNPTDVNNQGKFIVGKEDVISYKNSTFPGEEIQWSEVDFAINQYEIDQYYFSDALISPSTDNKLQRTNTIYHEMMIYDLRICDHKVFSNYGDSWNVIINTGIEGLAMPQEFVKVFNSWIDWSTMNESLPVMTFKLSEDSSEVLEFPLDLLFDNQTEFLHLYDATNLNIVLYELTPNGNPSIQFGTRVLEFFYTIMDTQKHRIGLIQKTKNLNLTKSCTEPVHCSSYQTLLETENKCQGQPCENYFFQVADDNGKCIYRIDFPIVILSFVVFFCIIDYTVVELFLCFSRKFKNHKNNPIYG